MQDKALQLFQRGAIKNNPCNEHHLLHLHRKKPDLGYFTKHWWASHCGNYLREKNCAQVFSSAFPFVITSFLSL